MHSVNYTDRNKNSCKFKLVYLKLFKLAAPIQVASHAKAEGCAFADIANASRFRRMILRRNTKEHTVNVTITRVIIREGSSAEVGFANNN
jgi:hypothetical protein